MKLDTLYLFDYSNYINIILDLFKKIFSYIIVNYIFRFLSKEKDNNEDNDNKILNIRNSLSKQEKENLKNLLHCIKIMILL